MNVDHNSPIPTPTVPAPDIVRCAYAELVVTDLARSREFYVDVLGLHVTEEDDDSVYLRSFEEFIHHNLVLRRGPVAAVRALAYRVRTPEDVDRAEAYYRALGCRTERRAEGFVNGVGDAVRVEDPLGFPYEFFHAVDHVERLHQRYDLYGAGELVRLDHFNQVVPNVPRGRAYLENLGFRVSEDIKDAAGTTYAAWMHRKQTVHDTALTGGDGPRMHHIAFATHEKHNIIQICDKMGSLRISDRINTGQTCAALKRLYVHEDVYDAVCEALLRVARSTRSGHGVDPGVTLGPLTTAAQFDVVDRLVEDARLSGARILIGGEPDRAAPGNFYPATLVADIAPDRPLVTEEQFGPALPIVRFREVDEAVALANAGGAGLGGSVWSADVDAARAIAARLRTGTVWINRHGAVHPMVPFGGVGASGYGLEFGVEGLKSVAVPQVING
ncbi:aldehyde dehydrogenase family protein [Tsukamurella sputi]|uniref:Aldehyde dehydrogenase family protein n=1 Tax=Tsukamurella sputi TaxID=2591848 RepID=A0A5C5RM47_9ACTN|nr:aldehyde dehydrogenase family protein [Tsukamurella sputi]TWS24006.1 aldehyde dehydrogenase family protein [Tsukamurella sputi]